MNKTDSATNLVSTSMVIVFLLISTFGTAAVFAVQPTGTCKTPTTEQLSSLEHADSAGVIAVARGSSMFLEATIGASVSLGGVSYDAYLDHTTCNFTANAIDGTFVETYPNGTQWTILVTETLPPSIVTGVQREPMLYASLGQTVSDSWSGYQLDALPGGSNVAIFSAVGDFLQPTVDKPGNHKANQPGCNWWVAYCVLATWVGVSTSTQSGALLQAGTLGTARADGSISYQMWWEDNQAGGVKYCSQTMNADDEIGPQITNAAVYGGDPNS